jgi:L-alanine-DL-glutamate epimerase-like enolase superfamily enzyme
MEHRATVGKGPPSGGARPEQEEKPVDQDGFLRVPDGPGIGVTPIEAAIKEGRMPGEPYWD